MFDHPLFDRYSLDNIPLNEELYLMDETWMVEYEKSLIKMFEGGKREYVGRVGYAVVKSIGASTVELSCYPNTFTRFHEVQDIALPKKQIVACIGSHSWGEDPHIFVKSKWLDSLHLRSYSVFALVDASDFTVRLKSGSITRTKLLSLRREVDTVAKKYSDVLFISFADTLLLKSNWRVGHYKSRIKYTYEPERFIRLISELRDAYRKTLELNVYAVLTQGSNEFYADPVAHISATKNHISLNSLGLPFAQLQSIEHNAKRLSRTFGRADLYMDETFFHSLDLAPEFRRDSCRKDVYQAPLTDRMGSFYSASLREILESLPAEKS